MEDPQRPLPSRSLVDRFRSWTEWIGYWRIVGSALAMAIVCAGAYWLIRTPPPPTEASLPLATTSVVPPVPLAGSTETTAAGPPITGAPSPVFVHVAGAVVTPGVYEMAPDARVGAALAAAGGALAGADPNALNLAAPLIDGSRIYVPTVGEVVPSTLAPVTIGTGATGDPAGTVTGPIDVNQATGVELEALPGVGPATATAIVAERERNGPFLSVDDLDRVPGIGPATIEALGDLVTT